MTLESVPSERGIHIVATPVDKADKLVAERSSVMLALWREGPTVIRGTITHSSGAVAYFQGGEALLQIARALRVRLKRGD